MICTVLVLWFAAVAIAGIVIGSYDSESARTMILGIVAGTVVFLALVNGRHLDIELEDPGLIDWQEKKVSYGKRVAKKA